MNKFQSATPEEVIQITIAMLEELPNMKTNCGKTKDLIPALKTAITEIEESKEDLMAYIQAIQNQQE